MKITILITLKMIAHQPQAKQRNHIIVIPAQAEISCLRRMDSRLRGNDRVF